MQEVGMGRAAACRFALRRNIIRYLLIEVLFLFYFLNQKMEMEWQIFYTGFFFF